MGKTKIKRRSKKTTVNPTGIPSIKELEKLDLEIDSTNMDPGIVERILEQLQSGEEVDKECAANNIANMVDNQNFVAKLMKNKVVRLSGPLLVDRNPAVQLAVLGCFRNLAICGDYSVSQAMIDQDILTSLVTLFLTYKEAWSPSPSIVDTYGSKSEIFLEACKLLWSLCQNSKTAVDVFNNRKLIRVLLPCLNISVYGLQIPLAIAQCLHTVGEDNSEVTEEVSTPFVQEQLRALMALESDQPEHILLKTLAAGIMMNAITGKVHNSMSDVTNPILKVTTDTLNEPIKPALIQLSEDISSHEKVRQNLKMCDKKDLQKKLNALNKSISMLSYLLQAKQISLEIITNICCDDDSNDEWDDISTSDTSEEMEMDIFETSDTPLTVTEISSEIHLIILHHELLQKVIDQIILPTEDVMKVITSYSRSKSIINRLNTVRCRALLCLNNLVQTLTVDELGGPAKLFELWMNIANLLFKETESTNTEQLEATTHSMRAVLLKLAEAKCSSQFSNLSESDLQLLMNIYHESQEAAIKVNIISALGTIGSLIGDVGLLQSSYKLIHAIGSFLLEICSKSSDLWVIAEALDAIFDVFAEDHVDYIAQEISLVEKLEHLKNMLKGKVKQHRKSCDDHFSVITTAKTNLLRFIQYKNQQRKK